MTFSALFTRTFSQKLWAKVRSTEFAETENEELECSESNFTNAGGSICSQPSLAGIVNPPNVTFFRGRFGPFGTLWVN